MIRNCRRIARALLTNDEDASVLNLPQLGGIIEMPQRYCTAGPAVTVKTSGFDYPARVCNVVLRHRSQGQILKLWIDVFATGIIWCKGAVPSGPAARES